MRSRLRSSLRVAPIVMGLAAAMILAASCTRGRPAPVRVGPPPSQLSGTSTMSAEVRYVERLPVPVMKPRAATVVARAPDPEIDTTRMPDPEIRTTRASDARPVRVSAAAPREVNRPAAVRVQRGDTLYAISRRHEVAVRDLIRLNRLRPPYKLLVGQTLRLPVTRYHTVQRGDTVYGVSRRYDVDMSVLVRANRIPPPYRLEVGQRLQVPSPIQLASYQPASAEAKQSAAEPPAAHAPRVTAKRPPKKLPGKPPPRSSDHFAWPVKGKIVSTFGPKRGGLHNEGINIAVPRGSPVYAAENGVVAYAGNELRGYGNLILVRHTGGWISAYAHNEALLVQRGDVVERGQVIARSGTSGNVSSPQAHFELRKNGKPVDPMRFLVRT